MPAYVGFLIDIHDSAAFSAYARAAAPTYGKYGGKIILRGPIAEIVEGALDVREDTRLVIIEFPSMVSAHSWWDSDEYRRLVELRKPPVSDSRVLFVDGIDIRRRSG
jgi:uncharacterized protein (DUF1330 family)